jgi:hypothetical protein
MNIEKTYKLTIKDTAFNLTEEEVSALYTECGKALNIGVTDSPYPNYPPGVRKFDPVVPTYPNWPTYPYPTYCGDSPFGTTTNQSVMDWHNYHGTGGIKSATVPSSNSINFVKDDMETIKDNNDWRSCVAEAINKFNAGKTNDTTTKSDGTNIR